MGVHRPQFGEMRARLATVSFACDLLADDGIEIPLGVFAEIRFGEWYGLGITARSKLGEAELRHLEPLSQLIVSRPFDFLKEQFTEIYEAEHPDNAFTAMCARNGGSLVTRLEESTAIADFPPRFRKGEDDEGLKAFLKHKLSMLTGEHYWKLVRDEASAPDDLEEVRAA